VYNTKEDESSFVQSGMLYSMEKTLWEHGCDDPQV
jgi:hypothetical protein